MALPTNGIGATAIAGVVLEYFFIGTSLGCIASQWFISVYFSSCQLSAYLETNSCGSAGQLHDFHLGRCSISMLLFTGYNYWLTELLQFRFRVLCARLLTSVFYAPWPVLVFLRRLRRILESP